MHVHIHGYPVALALVFFVTGCGFWHYKKLHRVSAWFLGAAAFLLAIGVTPWTDALGSLIASGTGLTVLILAAIVSGLGFWYEAILKHMHHRIRTPALAITFGTSLFLTIASIGRIVSNALKSPAKTGSALSRAVNQIQSGHAAQATTQSHALGILAIAAGLLVAMIMFAHKVERGSGPARAPRAAAGPGSTRRVAGRPAIPLMPGRKR